MEKALLLGDFETALAEVLPVVLYGLGTTLVAVLLFLRQMNRQ